MNGIEFSEIERSVDSIFGFISNYHEVIIGSWYILLPIAIFFVLFSKISSKVSLFIIGFYMTFMFLVPLLLEFEQIQTFIMENEEVKNIIYFVFSFVVGMLLYFLFNYVMALTGAAIGGFLGFYLGSFIIDTQHEWIENLNFDPIIIPIVIGVVFAVLLAILSIKYFEKIIATVSILFGAFMLGYYSLYGLVKFADVNIGEKAIITPNIPLSNTEKIVIAVFTIIYIIVGFLTSFKVKKSSKTS